MRKAAVVLLSVLTLVVGLTSYAEAAKPAYKVSLSTSVHSSSAGRFVTVAGKVVGPKVSGKSVAIQRRYVGGPWVTVATATISSRGKYHARVETPRGGTTSFRAIKGRSSIRSAGVSPTRSIPVYQWLNLAAESSLHDSDFQSGVQETVGGATAPSVDMYADDVIEWKVGGLCTSVTMKAAYSGPSEASVEFDLLKTPTGGGASTSIPSTVTTAAAPVTVGTSLAGFRYLLFETNGFDSGFKLTAWNPRAYCNADALPAFTLEELK